MKAVINCLRLLPLDKGAGGAGSYLLSLLREMARIAEVRVIANPRTYKLLSAIPGIDVIPILSEEPSFFAAQAKWCDVFYDPLNGLAPTFMDSRVPTLCCIHDLQHNVYPHYFHDGSFEGRNRDYGFAIDRADSLIAISEFEKQNFETFFGKKSVHVVHHGGYLAEHYDDAATRSLKARGVIPDGDYVLYPAVPWRHKNHYRLIEAVRLLRRFLDRNGVKLILTGALEHSSRSKPLFELLLRSETDQQDIELRGFIKDVELAALFKNAKAMIFPSIYEGFGIPLVEAMQMGTPVLAARMTAVPEVCGDAVAYFRDPLNSYTMAEDIQDLLASPARLEALRLSGLVQGGRYSSQRMAQETLAAFKATKEAVESQAPVEIISARPAVGSRRPVEKLTLLVTCDDAATAAAADPAAYVAALAARLDRQVPHPYRRVFLIPSDLDKDVVAGLNAAAMEHGLVVFYDGSDKRRLPLATRFAVDSILETRYLLYTRASKLTTTTPRRLRDAMALLDYHTDIGAAEFMEGAPAQGSIWRPANKDQIYKAFIKHRDDPLSRFENVLLARRVFEHSDGLGTIRFLSYFLKNTSTILLPETDC